MYSLGLLITTILAYCLRYTYVDMMYPCYMLLTIMLIYHSKWGHQIKGVQLTESCGADCWNYLAVDRVSLGFVLYHSLLCLLTIGVKSSSDPRATIHNGYVMYSRVYVYNWV
jgi:hypothetical protein